jgi:hypothetical protein
MMQAGASGAAGEESERWQAGPWCTAARQHSRGGELGHSAGREERAEAPYTEQDGKDSTYPGRTSPAGRYEGLVLAHGKGAAGPAEEALV